MKKLFSILFVASLLVMLCSCGSSKLADGFNQNEVTAKAHEIITLINDGNYQSVTDQTRSDLQDNLSASVLQNAFSALLQSAGGFKEFSKTTVLGQQDSSTKEDYAVVIVVAQYENKKMTYTISLDTKLEIVGLYLK